MNIFVKELDNDDKVLNKKLIPKFIQKIIIKFIEKTNKFFIVDIDEENKIFVLPNIEKEKVYKNIVKKVKTIKTKRKTELVLSKEVKKYTRFLNGMKIRNGKTILVDSIDNILQKIIGEIKIETIDLYILANSYTQTSVNFIKKISKKVKSVNLITNRVDKYKMIEEMLLEEGIAISISNNKKKSLKNSKIIINLDFNNEDIKKYNINRNACIINIGNDTITNIIHGFEGVIIQNIDVIISNKNFFESNNIYDKFEKIDLFETIKSQKMDLEIEALYGLNGKISEKELLNVRKILTNLKI